MTDQTPPVQSQSKQGDREPPARLILVWCSCCGRDDRFTALRELLPHRTPSGKKCSGQPTRLLYDLRKQGEGRA